jgi:hypothetical protein
MAFEQKDNSGALFKNDDKTPDNNYPDYRGPCMVNGKELEVSAWLKTSAKGTEFMSLSFKPPFKKTTKVAGDNDTAPRGRTAPDDDSPW